MSLHKLRIFCSRSAHPFSVKDPVHQPLAGNTLDLWYAPLAPLVSLQDRLIEELDPEEQARANRFRFEKDRDRFVIGHYLLRHVLAHHTEQAPDQLQFGRLEFGKPFLIDHPDLHFNFSDTRNAILIGVTKTCPVGVDIETTQRDVDHNGVAEHFFTEREISELQGACDPKYRFLEFWTRKEAILKASGVGIMDDVRVLRVNDEQQEVAISHKDMVALSADQYHVVTGPIGDDNIMSMATPEPIDTWSVFDPLQL